MNLVKSEKLEKSMHELQFSVDAETCLLYTSDAADE